MKNITVYSSIQKLKSWKKAKVQLVAIALSVVTLISGCTPSQGKTKSERSNTKIEFVTKDFKSKLVHPTVEEIVDVPETMKKEETVVPNTPQIPVSPDKPKENELHTTTTDNSVKDQARDYLGMMNTKLKTLQSKQSMINNTISLLTQRYDTILQQYNEIEAISQNSKKLLTGADNKTVKAAQDYDAQILFYMNAVKQTMDEIKETISVLNVEQTNIANYGNNILSLEKGVSNLKTATELTPYVDLLCAIEKSVATVDVTIELGNTQLNYADFTDYVDLAKEAYDMMKKLQEDNTVSHSSGGDSSSDDGGSSNPVPDPEPTPEPGAPDSGSGSSPVEKEDNVTPDGDIDDSHYIEGPDNAMPEPSASEEEAAVEMSLHHSFVKVLQY